MTTQDIINNLDDCPFCGGAPDGSELLTGFSFTSDVHCEECGASAPYRFWNKRLVPKDNLVFKCNEYSIQANEVGFLIKTADRTKFVRLSHFLDYELELENENEDLKGHVRKWEEFWADVAKSLVKIS